MKKPELKDFDYDGADMADWYKGYSEALENYTEHLESYANQKALTIIEQAVTDLIEVYGDDNERYDAMYHGGWILETVRRKIMEE